MMRRGEVWVANLNPPRGREIGKVRPVLVIQNEDLDASVTPMVVCLPLTSQVYPSFTRWRVTLSARDRLLEPCQVMTDQPRAIDRMQFGDGPLTTLTVAEMAAVEQSLRAVLDLW